MSQWDYPDSVNKSSEDPIASLANDRSYPPHFEEFIRFIICQWRAGQQLDEHWAPITKFCTPCQVNFDIIIKFETLNVKSFNAFILMYDLN